MLFKDVYDHFQYDIIISRDSMHHYLKLIEIMPDAYDDLIRLLILNRLPLDAIENGKEYNNHIKNLCLYNTKHLFMKLHLLHYYAYTEQFESFKLILDDLEKRYNSFKNYVRLLDVYNFAFILYSYIDTEYIEVYIEKVKKLTKIHVLPDIKISEIYSNIASSYHNRAEYANALHYYTQSLLFYRGDLVRQGILIADCQNRLGKVIDIPYVEDEEFQEYPLSIKLMYKYFCLAKEVPAFVRQTYIMKKLLPHLTDEVCIDIFQYELSKLVEKTNNYKMLYEFDREVRKHTS